MQANTTSNEKHYGLEVNQIERKAKIRAWFISHGLTQRQVAETLGISPQRFGRVLNGVYPQPEHIAYLQKIGMPEDLLPQPKKTSR